MAKIRGKPAFDPRRYPDDLPCMCKLALIKELGTIEEARAFAYINRHELATELPIKAKLQKSDARIRRNLAEIARRGREDDFYPSRDPMAIPTSSGSLVAGMLFNTLAIPYEVDAKNQKKSSTRIVISQRGSGVDRVFTSRAGAGAKLKSDEVKSLRTRAWFNSLMASISYGMSNAYSDAYALGKSRSIFLKRIWLREGVPTSPSEIVELQFDSNRAVRKKRLVALDLYKRDYENGSTRPSAKTLYDLELVFPRTASVYEVGFYGMPVWELFDGNESVCRDFLKMYIPGLAQGTPDQWAQHILDLALKAGTGEAIRPFLDKDDFYGFNAVLGAAIPRSFDRMDLKFAYLAMASIAAFQIFETTKLLPTKSLQWVISAFYRMGVYRHFFGPIVDDFIKHGYLKKLPAFKI